MFSYCAYNIDLSDKTINKESVKNNTMIYDAVKADYCMQNSFQLSWTEIGD